MAQVVRQHAPTSHKPASSLCLVSCRCSSTISRCHLVALLYGSTLHDTFPGQSCLVGTVISEGLTRRNAPLVQYDATVRLGLLRTVILC